MLHGFSFTKCLEIYGIKEDILHDYLHIEKFSKVPMCITCNPHQKALLLIHKAESKTLSNDMTLALNDLKMFIGSGVKLIPLVESDGKPKVDCDKCLNHVLSESELRAFTSLWGKRYFQIRSE